MSASGLPRVILTASVDTEEDNWEPTRTGITVANIAAVPGMHARMSALGLRVTYFLAHSVATDLSAVAAVRELAAEGAEIAAHLHPWNTPPLDETMVPRNSMLKNLPAELQLRKIARLTERIAEAFGNAPTAFRAGRFALGPATVEALVRNGYRVDSSVMPWIDWRDTDDGPDFFGAPQHVYRLAADASVTSSSADGPILEVPLSTGFNRWPFLPWATFHRGLRTGVPHRLRLAGVAHRTGFLRRILISPEGGETRDMLQLARLLVSHGVEHLQIMWHSPTLVPGLTPFARTRDDVDLLYRKVEDFVHGLKEFAAVTFATVSETAESIISRRERVDRSAGTEVAR